MINLNVKIEKQVYSVPEDSRIAKVTEMNHITKIQTCAVKNAGPPCQKVDKDHYVDLRSGELFVYNHSETRAEYAEGIARTLENIRNLINCNVSEPDACRWVTLTYAENMQDTKRLYEDFHSFWKRFKRWCVSKGFLIPEYISVIEPQGRGAWHVHAFFIWSGKAPFIENKELRRLWSHGFVSVKAVKDCDNIGAYFSAYLADMPLSDLEKIPAQEREELLKLSISEKTDSEGLPKKIVKGARLHFYPSGMNIVRRSRGIKDPEISWTTYGEAKKKASSAKLTFSDSYAIKLEDSTKILNTYTVEYYNAKR